MSYQVRTFQSAPHQLSSANKNLSICLKPDGFSFTISTDNNHLLTYCDVQADTRASISALSADIKALFADKQLSTFGYSRAELIVQTELSTWIPEHLFEKGKERQYLALVGSIKQGNSVFADINPLIKSYIVFEAPSTATSAFKIVFPGISIRCQHSKFVTQQLLSEAPTCLLVHLRKGTFDIMASSNSTLQLTNSFPFNNLSEAIYRTLSVVKMLNLESSDLQLNLCGDVDRDSYRQYQRYFPHVKLYTGILMPQSDEMAPIHTYKDILVF